MRSTPTNPTTRSRARAGAAYVVTLLVTTVLAAVVLVFAKEMRVEADTATNRSSQTRARWIARGALEAVRGDLAEVIAIGDAPRLDQVGAQAVPMGDGLFWLIKPNYRDDRELAYGLQGEAGKFHLDKPAGLELLDRRGLDILEIPGMTEDLAAAILDWQDRNERITPGGAESAYYLSRETSYNIKNRDLETVGELMYVRGMTEELLYGEDTNRNGRLDPNEDDGDATEPNDDADGRLDRGYLDYFTVYTIDPGVSDSGREKLTIDVRDPPRVNNGQYRELQEFLSSELGEERGTELADKSFDYTGRNGSNEIYLSVLQFFVVTEATDDEFELIHDGLKRADNDEEFEGLIDVYHASPAVLETIPGLEPGDGQLIVDARPEFKPGEPIRNMSWLVDVIGEQKAIVAGRFLTHRSHQITADIVAITGDGRGFCRLRVVLDCSPVLEGEATLPRVRYMEDLTPLGWPLDEEIREQIRGGATPEEIATLYAEDNR